MFNKKQTNVIKMLASAEVEHACHDKYRTELLKIVSAIESESELSKEHLIIIRVLIKAENKKTFPDDYHAFISELVKVINNSPLLSKDRAHIDSMKKTYDDITSQQYEVYGEFSIPGMYTTSVIYTTGRPVIGKEYGVDCPDGIQRMTLNNVLSCDKIEAAVNSDHSTCPHCFGTGNHQGSETGMRPCDKCNK